MADMQTLTINGIEYNIKDAGSIQNDVSTQIANLNDMLSEMSDYSIVMGRVGPNTLYRPSGINNGLVLCLKYAGSGQQYIFSYTDPGRIYSRIHGNGAWHEKWNYVSLTSEADPVTEIQSE